MARDIIRVRSIVERKRASLPRFLTIPASALESWGLEGTTVVEARVNGTEIGRRSLKRWRERDVWFFDLTEAQCERTGIEAGDEVRVELRRASTAPPEEIERLIASDRGARAAWEALSKARRRQIAEHVRAAVRPETRRRRAERALSGG